MRLDRVQLAAAVESKDVVAIAATFGAATEGKSAEWYAACSTTSRNLRFVR